MTNYFYIEFLVGNKQFTNCLTKLTPEYLEAIYTAHGEDTLHCMTVITDEVMRERYNYNNPLYLNKQYGITDDILLEGVRAAKKDELRVMLEKYSGNADLARKIDSLSLGELLQFNVIKQLKTPSKSETSTGKAKNKDKMVK